MIAQCTNFRQLNPWYLPKQYTGVFVSLKPRKIPWRAKETTNAGAPIALRIRNRCAGARIEENCRKKSMQNIIFVHDSDTHTSMSLLVCDCAWDRIIILISSTRWKETGRVLEFQYTSRCIPVICPSDWEAVQILKIGPQPQRCQCKQLVVRLWIQMISATFPWQVLKIFHGHLPLHL